MSSDFGLGQLRFQSWSQLPRFNSEVQKSPKKIKDSPVSTLAYDEQKIYGFCPHQDLMCVAQCSTCHSHFKLRSLRTHMNNRHNAKLKSPEGLSHGFTDVSSPPQLSEIRTKAEISSDSGVSTSSSTSRDSRRNTSPSSLSLPSDTTNDDGLANLFEKFTADKADLPPVRRVKTESSSTDSEPRGKLIDTSQLDAKLQKPRVKLKNAVEAAVVRNRAKLTSPGCSDVSPIVTVTTKSSLDSKSSKSAQIEYEKIPFFPPEIPTRSTPAHHHSSSVVGMLRTPSLPTPMGRKLPTTTNEPLPVLTRTAKSEAEISSLVSKKVLKPAASGNSFVNILGSTPRLSGGLNVQISNKPDSNKPSTSDSVETQKGNITIRIKKAVLQQHAVKPKIGADKKPLSNSPMLRPMTEESLSVKTSASYPNLLNLEDSSGSLIGGQSGMDDGTHLSVGETVVIGEVQKKKPTKKGKKQSVVDTHTTIHSGRPASNSNAVPKPKTFDDLLMEEIQLQSSTDCQTLDPDAFLNRFDEFLLDDFKPQSQTVEQLKNGLIHDPLMPSVSGTTADWVEDNLVPTIVATPEVIPAPPVLFSDFSQAKWNDTNNNPPTPAAVNNFGARRLGSAVYVFNRGYDSVRSSVQRAINDHQNIKTETSVGQSRPELLVTPKFQQPTTSPQLDYFLNRPYEQVRIGSVRKRTEPALLSGAQVLQRISPIVVRPSDISPCAVVGSNCTVGEKGRKEQMKALQTGVKPLSKPISIGRHQQQPFRDGFTAPILTLQQRPQIFQKTIQSARNSPTGTAGQMSFAVQLSDRCASAPVICDIDMANRNSPSGSDFSPFSQAGKPPTLLPAVSVSGSEVPSVSRVVNVSASRRSTQLASVDSTLSAMLAGALHKGKANAAGTNLKRQRTTPPTNVVSSTNPYGSSTQSSQMGNGIYYASDLKRQKLVDGLQHYVESSSDLYGSSNARRF